MGEHRFVLVDFTHMSRLSSSNPRNGSPKRRARQSVPEAQACNVNHESDRERPASNPEKLVYVSLNRSQRVRPAPDLRGGSRDAT